MYTILTDVLGGQVNSELLRMEIADSGFVNPFNGVIVQDGKINVLGTVLDQNGLDDLIRNHSVYSLVLAKAAKVLAIDTRTRAIIAGGFPFDGHQFSLSAQAQTNWLGLISLQSLFVWPMGITTNEDTTYLLAQGSVTAFVATGCGVIAAAIGSGRAMKIAANAASTHEDLDAVVDSR